MGKLLTIVATLYFAICGYGAARTGDTHAARLYVIILILIWNSYRDYYVDVPKEI